MHFVYYHRTNLKVLSSNYIITLQGAESTIQISKSRNVIVLKDCWKIKKYKR